jgi:hypothetical protein
MFLWSNTCCFCLFFCERTDVYLFYDRHKADTGESLSEFQVLITRLVRNVSRTFTWDNGGIFNHFKWPGVLVVRNEKNHQG